MDKYIYHFGVKIKNDPSRLKINRDNYAVIDNKNHNLAQSREKYYFMEACLGFEDEKIHDMGKRYFDNFNHIYTDKTMEYFTDEFCENQREACLYNYDLNMNYFKKLDLDEFNDVIEKVKKEYKEVYEIDDLNKVKETSGVYIMVFDEYKQLYVGETYNIYKRIKQHWSSKKQFMRLIFGTEENSILSIDCFGPLDTTRIFICESLNTKTMEEKIFQSIPNKFLLNRTRGGERGYDSDTTMIDTLAHMNVRDFKSN